MAISVILAEFGVGSVVVQMHDLSARAIRQLNAVAAMFSALIYFLSISASPLLGRLYEDSRVPLVFAVAAASLLLNGLSSVPMSLARRELDYRFLSIVDVVRAVIQTGVTLGSALAGLGYWSLIAGYLAGDLSSLVAILTRYRVGFAKPVWREIHPALRFGFNVSASQLCVAAYTHSSSMVIGRNLGANMVGAYQLAAILANTPIEKVASMMMRVTGPVFAKAQNDLALIRRYLLVFTESLTVGVAPLTAGVALLSEDLIVFVFKDQWVASAEPMKWLSLFAALRLCATLLGQVQYALKDTFSVLGQSLASLLVLPIAFYVGTYYGLWAVAAAWLLLLPLNFAPALMRIHARARLSYWEYAKSLVPAIVCCSAMIVSLLLLRSFLENYVMPLPIKLGIQVAVGAFVYIAVLFSLFHHRVRKYASFFQEIRRPKQHTVNVSTP